MPRLASTLLLALATTTACADEADPPDPGPVPPGAAIELDGLDASSVIGGAQTTHIRARSELGVVRVELFLDTMRVGVAELAPFDVAWDTAAFADGRHELIARAHLGDGRLVDRKQPIVLDNTAPTIGYLEGVERGAPIELPVGDNLGVARVVVSGAITADLAAPPFRATWDGPCGVGEVTIAVTDRAGWTTEQTQRLEVVDPADRDCDGYPSTARGGTDCNDDASWIHPGRDDGGEDPIDLDCDGVPGVDGDGDGVASTATGGVDCDDGDATVFGSAVSWRAVTVDASWLHIAGRVARIGSTLHVVTEAPGLQALRHRRYDAAGALVGDAVIAERTENASDLLVDGATLRVAYSLRGRLTLATWSGLSWTYRTIATGGDWVLAADLERGADGLVLALATTAGVVLAREDGDGWHLETVASVVGTTIALDAAHGVIALGEQNAVHRIDYGGDAPRVATHDAFEAGRPAIVDGVVFHEARVTRTGAASLYRDGAPLTTVDDAQDLATLRLPHGALLVESGSNEGFLTTAGTRVPSGLGWRSVQAVGASTGSDAVCVGASELHLLTGARAPASDPANDGVDRDCDGVD